MKTLCVPTTFAQIHLLVFQGVMGESGNSEIVKHHRNDHVWCTKGTEVIQRSEVRG